jgi:hypothetical protein
MNKRGMPSGSRRRETGMSQGLPAEIPRIPMKDMMDHRQRNPAPLPTIVRILKSNTVTPLPYLSAEHRG